MEFLDIYTKLNFLSESVRLQYTNFIVRHSKQRPDLGLDDIINRVKQEEPIEYIFNKAEFCGSTFYVDARCLIPRPETEEIVERAIQHLQSHTNTKHTIIDVGTGSGCIILSIAKKLKERTLLNHIDELIGIDISKNALEVASINKKNLDADEVQLINTPFQKYDFTQHTNLIVCSNLPYIPNGEILQKSVVEYEPHLALFGGEKGDELNSELIQKLKQSNREIALFIEGYNGKIETQLMQY